MSTKTTTTQPTETPPEKDQATAIGNVDIEFGEVWTSWGSWHACGQTDKLITIFHSPTEGEVIRSVTARPSVMWYFPIYALGIICLSYNHKIAVFKNVLQPQLFKLFESNHGLRGSGSPVLTVTGFVNGRGQFSTPPPQNPLTLTDHQKICC